MGKRATLNKEVTLKHHRAKKQKLTNYEERNHFQLIDIIPLTPNQRKTFLAFRTGKNLFLHGVAGTGKTFMSIYLSMKELEDGAYDKIIIYRSTVPSRDMGFLPGNVKEKVRQYEAPYRDICSKLYNRGDAYDVLKQKNIIEFESTSFVRGITIEDSIVIIDESQNLTWMEIYSLMTRLGNNCKIIICGDFRQTDLVKEQSGIAKLMRVVPRMQEVIETIEFDVEDIVRSKFVKSFIIACHDEHL